MSPTASHALASSTPNNQNNTVATATGGSGPQIFRGLSRLSINSGEDKVTDYEASTELIAIGKKHQPSNQPKKHNFEEEKKMKNNKSTAFISISENMMQDESGGDPECAR